MVSNNADRQTKEQTMTKKIVQRALKAQDLGYKYLTSVVKSHYATTYYHVVPVADVIKTGDWIPAPVGQWGDWRGRCGIAGNKLPDGCIRRDSAALGA